MIHQEERSSETLKKYGDNRYRPLEETLLFRPLSTRLARALGKTSIHPDQVSFIGFLFTLGTAATIAYLHPMRIVTALLLVISFVLDKADGDLARQKGIAGPKGQYVDGYLDVLGDVALVMGCAIAVNASPILSMLSVAAVVAFNYHGAAAPLYLTLPPSAHKQTGPKTFKDHCRDALSYGSAKFFLLLTVLALIGKLSWTFYVVPFLLLYTTALFARNIFIKKYAQR